MNKETPKSLRLQIGIFGRTNVGKSSFLNMIAGQDVAITSPEPGTTTDVVEKTMELLPVGPVVFLDTAGIDDATSLSDKRLSKTNKIFDRADVAVLVAEPDEWTVYEEKIIEESGKRKTPLMVIVNKTDIKKPSGEMLKKIPPEHGVIQVSSTDRQKRDVQVSAIKEALLKMVPADFFEPPNIIGDLVPKGGSVALIIPIDLEAPKGRIILPQVQTIRDCLDSDVAALVVKESGYKSLLEGLKKGPDLAVCDSQAVAEMVAMTPKNVKCTTFSILFSRYKGDLEEYVKGVRAIDTLKKDDKVLIAESCSHHAIDGDIGRIKIPAWLEKYLGFRPEIVVSSGRDYPDDLSSFKLIIHCGSCMLTRKETLIRTNKARAEGVAITNYGVCISYLNGVLQRVLEPFPGIAAAFNKSEFPERMRDGKCIACGGCTYEDIDCDAINGPEKKNGRRK